MLLHVPHVLTPDDLATLQGRLAAAPWGDGRVTAGHQSVRVKENLQLAENGDTARELGALVLRALERSALFMSAALPAFVYPPLFNKYEAGMNFGAHVDNAVRLVPGTTRRLRTDVSATLFLSAPQDYDGGELIVSDTYGTHSVKLPAGDLILYPATSLHRVAPVTRGARTASFFWVQSMVKADAERALLFDLDRSIVELSQNAADSPAVLRLTALYHNLVRKWGEPT
ncbi:MAG TPA: Fe2+-dependent dioxygenase [Rhizomicrobium sp.]|jgi:PKHD-type hydroxylase|nr:Fe2+-dependent dioxygenase [Rhizomicrobium sp.]